MNAILEDVRMFQAHGVLPYGPNPMEQPALFFEALNIVTLVQHDVAARKRTEADGG